MADAPVVPARVRALAAQVGDPTPMRRGSLSERYVKCSKPGCRCAERTEARHGPYYSLTRTVAGRTQSRFLPAAQASSCASRSRRGSSSGGTSTPTGRPASTGPTPSSRHAPRRPLGGRKKRARRGRRGRSRRGDRHARRRRRRRGLGLRGDRGGGAPRGAARGGPRRRAPDQRRHLGPRRADGAVRLRAARALRRPPGQDLHRASWGR